MSLLATITVTFVVFLLAVAAMAVGVMIGRPPIKGSCGGLGSSGACEICTGRCRMARRRARMGQPDQEIHSER